MYKCNYIFFLISTCHVWAQIFGELYLYNVQNMRKCCICTDYIHTIDWCMEFVQTNKSIIWGSILWCFVVKGGCLPRVNSVVFCQGPIACATHYIVHSQCNSTYKLLRLSEANEVPISSHIWVGLSTFNRL